MAAAGVVILAALAVYFLYQAQAPAGEGTMPPQVTLSSSADGSTTSDQTPTLEWFSVSGADRYQIQVDDSSYFSSPAIDETTTSTSHTCSALSDGTYYWRVRAVSPNGVNGPWSATWDFTVAFQGVVSSFNSPGSSPRGLAWDGTYLWNADYTTDKIYKIAV